MSNENRAFLHKLGKKFGKTLEKFNLLKEGDKLIVGLSGGKDSLVLLDLLAFKKKQILINFDLIAVHVRSNSIPYESDINYLKEFCTARSIPLIIREFEVDFSTDKRKTPCFLCSTSRRKELFDVARELNANKVALGHHMNDSVETLLMNMIFNGSISAIPAELNIFNGEMQIIRPLIELTEIEIAQYAEINKYKTQTLVCPHNDKTQRKAIKKLIDQITEIYPYGLQSINTSMSRIFAEYLVKTPKAEEDENIG